MLLKRLLLISSFIAVLSGHSVSAQTFIIVRHGETADGDNPSLSPAGLARAQTLKDIVKGKQPDIVISSQLKRTHQTAIAFTDDNSKVEVVHLNFIEGASLDVIVAAYTEKLTKRLNNIDEDKVVFVSTHGHVLPPLVKNLTGTDIPHTGCEYDHLVTIIRKNGKSTVTHGRYGIRTPACQE